MQAKRLVPALQVLIELPGRPVLDVELPFGVDARQGRAHLLNAGRKLILKLPYKSYRSFTQVRDAAGYSALATNLVE